MKVPLSQLLFTLITFEIEGRLFKMEISIPVKVDGVAIYRCDYEAVTWYQLT